MIMNNSTRIDFNFDIISSERKIKWIEKIIKCSKPRSPKSRLFAEKYFVTCFAVSDYFPTIRGYIHNLQSTLSDTTIP